MYVSSYLVRPWSAYSKLSNSHPFSWLPLHTFCLQFVYIKRNKIFIYNYNVSEIFARMRLNLPIQITILIDIIMSQQPSELFQIFQGKTFTEIRSWIIISFSITRPNKNNRKQRTTLYSKWRKHWVEKLTNWPSNVTEFVIILSYEK